MNSLSFLVVLTATGLPHSFIKEKTEVRKSKQLNKNIYCYRTWYAQEKVDCRLILSETLVTIDNINYRGTSKYSASKRLTNITLQRLDFVPFVIII